MTKKKKKAKKEKKEKRRQVARLPFKITFEDRRESVRRQVQNIFRLTEEALANRAIEDVIEKLVSMILSIETQGATEVIYLHEYLCERTNQLVEAESGIKDLESLLTLQGLVTESAQQEAGEVQKENKQFQEALEKNKGAFEEMTAQIQNLQEGLQSTQKNHEEAVTRVAERDDEIAGLEDSLSKNSKIIEYNRSLKVALKTIADAVKELDAKSGDRRKPLVDDLVESVEVIKTATFGLVLE